MSRVSQSVRPGALAEEASVSRAFRAGLMWGSGVGVGVWFGVLVTSNGLDLVDRALKGVR